MMPFGYEPNLMKSQKDKGAGIFECDEHAIYSNSTTWIKDGWGDLPISVDHVVPVSLWAPMGGRWHTALNTDVFLAVWREVCKIGAHRAHDWVVKVDPDSVFLPSRLRKELRGNTVTRQVIATARRLASASSKGGGRSSRVLQDQVAVGGNCGQCAKQEYLGRPCEDHVHYLQDRGTSCEDALEEVNRPAPLGCGCACSAYEACSLVNGAPKDLVRDGNVIEGKDGSGAVYVNNCRFGLHGPVEVLSSKAIDLYVEGVKRGDCANMRQWAWGEDKFMDRCMLQLGITRVNLFGILSEIACGDTPAPCAGRNAVFHPFKSIESYMACWSYAKLDSMGNVTEQV
jgi:bacterioferritin-associated ferredoxin